MKKFIGLTLICVLLLSLCGCIAERPEYLPGVKEEDVNFVWVCEKPFSYFVVDREELSNGYPCLKGYITKEGKPVCFYIEEALNVITCCVEESLWNIADSRDAFWGYTEYYEDYFEFEVEHDNINFFDGELPKLRFDKMRKEDFLAKYGDVENVSELLEKETD